MSRRGRRAGGTTASAAILAAAQAAFAARGYTATSIRQVAAAADVDPALVLHYYGSKRELFTAATGLSDQVEALIGNLMDGPVEDLGERLVRVYLRLVDAPDSPVVALLRSATSDEAAARTIREFVSEELIGRIVERLRVDDGALRASLVGTQLVGMAMLRRIVALEPLASAEHDTVVAWLAPTIQRYLTAPRPLDAMAP